MADLSGLLARAVATGEEFMLYYFPHVDKPWSCDLGNRSQMVLLGEVGGRYSAEGVTPEAVLAAVLEEYARETANLAKEQAKKELVARLSPAERELLGISDRETFQLED
jgi:hypothetical protein